jgi:predicted CopG family antitoxin
MRTTLTLDEDVCRKLKEISKREEKSFKQVVNETLRKGFRERSRADVEETFEVKAKNCGFRPGIDIGKLNQLSDELALEESQPHPRSGSAG